MQGRIDVHGHLLPGLDDGSRDLYESIELIRRMHQAGYSVLTCTPHIWPGYELYTPAFIRERVAELQQVVDDEQIAVRLIAGGELNIDSDILTGKSLADIPTYGMKGQYALFDFWMSELPDWFWPRVEQLRALHIQPILAHPERIGAIQNDPSLFNEFHERGLWLQGNLQCLADAPGKPTRELIERGLEAGLYFMLGSDVHRIETLDLRLKGLDRALQLLGKDEVDRLTITQPAKIIPL